VKVPLWLGIAMKKRSKCRIQPPDWMSVGEWDVQVIHFG
jgi:GINS complex subunit 2